MRALVGLFVLILVFISGLAFAEDYSPREFDARLLNAQEKRVIQAALAFSGDYVGLLDGAWGSGSQRALEKYTIRISNSDKPRFSDLRPLLRNFEAEWESNGWSILYSSTTNTSYAHPFGLLHKSGSADALAFRTEDDRLNLIVDFATLNDTLAVHRYFWNKATSYPEPYQSLKPERLITAVRLQNGFSAYVRSDLSDGIYVTLSIVAAPEQKTRLALMASSMQRGNGDRLTIPDGGILQSLLLPKTSASDPVGNSNNKPNYQSGGELSSSGTGFFVNNTDLVTAAHVIRVCKRLSLSDGSELMVLAADANLDLAVLTATKRSSNWLTLSPAIVPRLGEGVTALGYPYLGSLEQGLTVTGGNVSALQGIDGNKNEMMISAPVQPGNSGGPLLNSAGAVIGVVVARVNDFEILKETGTLPQNMNFAVPNGPLTEFLHRSDVLFPVAENVNLDVSSGIPDAILSSVVPVLCYE